MKFFLSLVFIVFVKCTWAQDQIILTLKKEANRKADIKAADSLPSAWHQGGSIGINLSQGSLSNWAAGGDNFNLSVNTLLNLFAVREQGKYRWVNTFNFNYGALKSTTLGSRKNDDRVDIFSKWGYALSPKWDFTLLGNFRTQLFQGYNYTDSSRTLSSTFLSPAYLLAGSGFEFKPAKSFSLYLSPVTARATLLKDDSLSAKGLYGVDSFDHARWDVGAFLSAGFNKAFNSVLSYNGRMDLYSNYNKNPQNVDLFMTNTFVVKLSKVLSLTWNVDLIYDDDVRLFGKENKSPALQLKSLAGVGFLVKFDNAIPKQKPEEEK